MGAEGEVAEATGGVNAEAGNGAEHLEAGFEVEDGAARGEAGDDHEGALLGGGLVVFLLLSVAVGSLAWALWRRRGEMGSLSLPTTHGEECRETGVGMGKWGEKSFLLTCRSGLPF